MYPWGSYVWPILYSELRNANVKRWQPLYATEEEEDVDHKSYSLFGFTWAFKTWILESFRVGAHDYYKRERRYPRVIAWRRLPTRRLTPDEFEAGLDWWVSSRAFFDGHISEAARIPRHVNRQTEDDVPSDFYREFEEQKKVLKEMMKKESAREQMYNQMRKFIE
ncbi:hypothetical protein Tco_1322470, partial [Tanacetum coccineum]